MKNIHHDQIAKWVIEYLKEKGKTSDTQLHWDACKQFLSRDIIMASGETLELFSEKYDDVLVNLERELYLYFRDGDYWVADKRDSDLARVIFSKVVKEKIKCFYIIEFDHGCKIGITTQMKNRVRSYISPWCMKIKSIEVLQNAEPLEVEDHIKKCFNNQSIRRTEFLTIGKDKIKKEVESAFAGAIFEKYYI